MQKEIIACLDGWPQSETILPLAQGIASPMGAALSLLRVVTDADELAVDEGYMRYLAGLFGARVKSIIAQDPASAIIEELRKSPDAIAAMTTHGRTAWMEAVIGSVALTVVRGAGRPVILYRPPASGVDSPSTIDTIVAALDGSAFSEKILPITVELAQSIRAKLILVHALALGSENLAARPSPTDISESSYLQSRAADIKRKYGIEPSWDTLYGEPGEALCRFVHALPNTMLALAAHARGGLERAIFGSVSATCLRHAGVPLLLSWPVAAP
jgi:nucleotide-binding universal stress UspA family protein